MALINDQEATALNINNLDTKYKQYSATLNELRDPNNLSYTTSNITNGIESVNSNITNVQQGVDLKEQLLNIITSNNQTDNLNQVSFNNVKTTQFPIDNLDYFPIEEVKVTCEEMAPIRTLTTNISKTLVTQHPFEPNFNFVEEGHFHRELPQAKSNNLKRVHNRLLLDKKDSQFFDISGQIKNDAPTLRRIPPSFLNEKCSEKPFEAEETTFSYTPASMWTIENSNVARHIRVEVYKVRFISHELSSDQDLLTNQLQTLYDACMNDVKFPKTEYFVQKIHSLREKLKHHPENELEILEKIDECHKMRDVEEKKMCEKRDSLLECWHMLKETRERSMPTTTLCLKWKAKKYTANDKHEEEVLFDKDLHQRASEIKRMKFLLSNENLDEEEIVNELKNNHEEMGLRMPGDTKWIPTLFESPRAELKDLSPEEQNRFKQLAKTKISVGFYMGIYEVLSDEVQLASDFNAFPNVGCHAIALHVPPSVKIHIFESGSSKRHELASVTIPVFNGEPPSFTEYEFTSSQPMSNGRMIQGFVEARCFVETDPGSLETIIKDTREEFIRKGTLIDRVKKRPIRMTTKLMTELVNKHDPNDPYLTSAIITMKAHKYSEDDKSFTLDTHSDSTLFASMAASDIWKQIPNRAYDLIRPTVENPDVYDPEMEKLNISDVVTQPPPSTFTNFFKSIFGFFKRDKKSRSISPEEAYCSHRIEEKSSILLHIHQILLTPLRYSEPETFSYTVASSSLKEGTPRQQKSAAKSKESNILVRISLQGVEHTSAFVNGQAEDFNQQIELRLVNDGETVPDYQQIEGKTIRIDIFDEYCKEELQFIGTLQIPLRSIFINGYISGIFSITSPHFTMEHVIPETLSKLAISISLKPRLVFDRPHLPCPVGETEEINDRAHWIWNTLRSDFPKRNYSILVMTNEGKSVLPCRMAVPQTITEISGFDELLAFVSMIPTNLAIDKHDNSAWATSDQVIENNNGTNIEHALLFCNILLGQNVDAYVVLGNDMVSGYDAYVLIIQEDKSRHGESDDYLKSNIEEEKKKKKVDKSKMVISKERLTLYNPTNGRVYKIDGDDVTLIDVATVFNGTNVWFNIHKPETPISEMNWNFNDTKYWLPFFDNKFSFVELKSPQPTDLIIPKANDNRVSYIKKKVKRIIEETVESFRPQTKWFLSIKHNLKDILFARKDIELTSQEKMNAFNELMKQTIQKFNNYRIVGSPFFISYVYDDDANDGILRNEIYDEIKKREICSCYLSEDGKVETQTTYYSVGIEVKAFPNEIYAIWVLLVALHPKQINENSSRLENPDDNKKDVKNQSDSYYYEEEEEEDENKVKPNQNNQESHSSHGLSSDVIEEEEEDVEFEQDKDESSTIKSKSKPNSPQESEKQKSRQSSPHESEKQKSATPKQKSDSPHDSEKRKSALNSSTAPKQVNNSPHDSEKPKSRQNSPRDSERPKSRMSSSTTPKEKNQSPHESEKQKSVKDEKVPDEIIEEEEEDVSDEATASPSVNSQSPTTPKEVEAKTESQSPVHSGRSKKTKRVKKRKHNDNQDDSDDESLSLSQISTQSSVITSSSEDINDYSPRPGKLTKVLMLGEALISSNANSPRSGRNDKSKSSEKGSVKGSAMSNNDGDRSSRSASSKKKVNKSDSSSRVTKKETEKDTLLKKKKNESEDEEASVEIKKAKQTTEDDDGVIYQISDVTLSVPSPGLIKYRNRMRDARKRNRNFINSDGSDDANDSVYQMKKQAVKKNASDVQTNLKKRKSDTRRKNRNDLSPPVKNPEKGDDDDQINVGKIVQKTTQSKRTLILLSSDSES